MLGNATENVELPQHAFAVHDHNEITCPGQIHKGDWRTSRELKDIEYLWRFWLLKCFLRIPLLLIICLPV